MAESIAPDGTRVGTGVLLDFRLLVQDVLGRILGGLDVLLFLDGLGGRAVAESPWPPGSAAVQTPHRVHEHHQEQRE